MNGKKNNFCIGNIPYKCIKNQNDNLKIWSTDITLKNFKY